jgi:hypothetical protein
MINPVQEYLVRNVKKVKEFLDKEIGLEYEIDYQDECRDIGDITVFGVEYEEHKKIREFITHNNLWAK